MGLTVTNTNTLKLLNIINRTTTNQSKTLERLSTGLKINRGSDDPSGLIALESLTAELTSVDAAIENNQRSDALLGVADGALAEVSSLLGNNLIKHDRQVKGIRDDLSHLKQVDVFPIAVDEAVVG